jgi:hypothetical protein
MKAERARRSSERFAALAEKAPTIERDARGLVRNGQGARWTEWSTSVESLLVNTFGAGSLFVSRFSERWTGGFPDYEGAKAVFRAAREEFDGGYSESLEAEVSSEVLGNFVALAKAALSEGHKDVAAVLAAAAVEDTLKKFATRNGLDVSGKELEEVVNALKTKGLVGGALKSTMSMMPKLRNHALHAEFDKLDRAVVGSMVGFVDAFLLEHF